MRFFGAVACSQASENTSLQILLLQCVNKKNDGGGGGWGQTTSHQHVCVHIQYKDKSIVEHEGKQLWDKMKWMCVCALGAVCEMCQCVVRTLQHQLAVVRGPRGGVGLQQGAVLQQPRHHNLLQRHYKDTGIFIGQ